MNWANEVYRGAEILNERICTKCKTEGYPRRHYHASEAGHCPLQIELSSMGPDPRVRSGQETLFLRDGFLHEESVVASLIAAGHRVVNRNLERCIRVQHLGEEIEVIYHVDGILDEKYVLECKAVKQYMFKKYFDGKAELPKWYVAQVQLYMYGEQQYGNDIREAMVFVKDRNSSNVFFIPIIFNHSFLFGHAGIFLYLAGIQKAKRTNVLLPKYEEANNECKFCSYRTFCWGE